VLARPGVLALLIFVLGLFSSAISAIVAATVLAELLGFANAPHGYKARAAVYGAYAIGTGAALLPIGEPLSTIAVAKLKQGFFYLVDVLFDAVFIIVAFFALYAYFTLKRLHAAGVEVEPYEPELREVFLRAAKIFIFIFALTILGEFFKPVAEVVAGAGEGGSLRLRHVVRRRRQRHAGRRARGAGDGRRRAEELPYFAGALRRLHHTGQRPPT
jgi:predicted cation transporter